MRDDDIDDTVIRRPRASTSPAAGRDGQAGLTSSSDEDAVADTVIRPLPPRPGGDTLGTAGSDPAADTVIRPLPPMPGGRSWDGGAEEAVADTVIRPVPQALPVAPTPADGVLPPDAGGPPAEETIVRPGRDTPGRSPAHGQQTDDDTIRGADRPTASPRWAGGGVPRDPVPTAGPAARVPSIRVGGRTIRLDHPVIVGRRPSLPRVVRGPAPELVTVPSSGGQVSSSHVLVHAEGEAAVVDDLRSTNGTVIRPAGAAPFRLPSGASNVVLTGTVVEIGDGNRIEILSPHLRVGPPADDLDPSPARPAVPPVPGTPRPPRERS